MLRRPVRTPFEAAVDTLVHSPFGSAPGSPSRGFHCPRADFFGFGAGLAFLAQVLELVVCEMLDPNERISRGADTDQLVKLDLDSRAVAVLGILDQEDHEECHNRGASVDDQLPGIGKAKERPGHRPYDHDGGG